MSYPTPPEQPHQQPYQQPYEQGGPPPQGGRRRNVWPFVAAGAGVLGLAVGLGVGLLVGGGGEGDRDAANAQAACTVVERLDADEPLPEEDALESPELWEITAISGLASAAGAGDEEYATLAERGQELSTAMRVNNLELVSESLRDLADECGELGLD
ncbi:hypothetical protein RDV89_09855 [Nocardioides zeae]|uniref:Uncharacterized protein n=1 Tax=Nocardioides imazamoxiresistens TaxID=3231893 RepID=A0ABU3PVY8_9ACTN|nr:hypothetical protein [Nocardioides zeae]MDT9593371.1 hypothetical protein [Nocardioides zeae]